MWFALEILNIKCMCLSVVHALTYPVKRDIRPFIVLKNNCREKTRLLNWVSLNKWTNIKSLYWQFWQGEHERLLSALAAHHGPQPDEQAGVEGGHGCHFCWYCWYRWVQLCGRRTLHLNQILLDSVWWKCFSATLPNNQFNCSEDEFCILHICSHASLDSSWKENSIFQRLFQTLID